MTRSTPSTTVPAPPPRAASLQRLVVIAAIVLVGGPMVISMVRSQVGAWHAAAAYEQSLQGNRTAAVERMDRAIAWESSNAAHWIRRAGWKLESGDASTAIPDCDHALALARMNFANLRSRLALEQLGRALNLSAYAHALENSDLEEALENVEEALGIFGNNAAMLDTRGYIHLLLGNSDEAQADLEKSVQMVESSYSQDRAAIRRTMREMIDKRPAEQSERALDEGLAVHYHHRGQMYRAIGLEEKAVKDIERAERLGYDPENGVW